MRILVTGASGFVGSRVVRHLLDRGHDDVHAIVGPSTDRWRLEGLLDRVVLHEARLSQPPIQPDLLIHLAWYTVPGRYLESSENLECLEESERLAASVRCRIVATGTCFEYAESSSPIREDSPLGPATLYARCKDSLRATLAARGGCSWVRLFPMYGPAEDPRRLIPAIAIALLEGREAPLSHGQQRRDYSHVDDAARAIVDVAESSFEGVVNVGSGVAPRVLELAEAVAQRVGRPELLRMGAVASPAGEPQCLAADVGRLRSLGWNPKHDLASGVDDVVSWWQRAPLGRRKPWRT